MLLHQHPPANRNQEFLLSIQTGVSFSIVMPNTTTKKNKANTIFFPLKLKQNALFVFVKFSSKVSEGFQ